MVSYHYGRDEYKLSMVCSNVCSQAKLGLNSIVLPMIYIWKLQYYCCYVYKVIANKMCIYNQYYYHTYIKKLLSIVRAV